jgi:hypothetical protein
MMHGSGSADAAARAGGAGLSVFGTIHPQLLNYGPDTPQADLPHAPRVRLASLESTFDSRFAAPATDDSSDLPATTGSVSSFDERFFFDGSVPLSSLKPRSSFEDRFGAAIASESGATRSASPAPSVTAVTAAPAPRVTNVAAAAPAPRIVATIPVPRPAPRRTAGYKLASLSDGPIPASYAPPDAAAAPTEPPKDTGPLSGDLSHTAIYDISAHTVYLPSGERLEAHSGLGGFMDDVRAVHLRKQGPTPPNVYELTMRERLFHGVQAIRLNPIDGAKMFGRDGMLVHPFMLGPQGDSNGCVSLKDYPKFLKAYQRGEVTRMVVVEQLDDPPGGRTAADWFSGAIKKIFGRSS